jgi:hypothetical protein
VSVFAEDKVALEQVFFPLPNISVINFKIIHPTALQTESNQTLICQTTIISQEVMCSIKLDAAPGQRGDRMLEGS